MEKKNTMLLTVIAVATLLVAVVGATFAYFSVTGQNTTGTGATVTSTTDEIGNVAIATTNAQMHIDTTANDFREAIGGTTSGVFWAKAGASAPIRTDYNASETDIVAFTLTASGASTVHYVCTVGVTANTTISNGNSLITGEYAVRLKAGAADTTSMDVYTSPSNNNTAISKTFTIHLAGGETSTITASAKLVNTAQEQQARLSNASIQTALAVSSFTCTTEAGAGTNSVA